MSGGWTGKTLRINLTNSNCAVEDTRMDWAEEYIGGRGLGARYLYDEVDPTIDSLAVENKMIFATGPLTGTNASCGARYMVITKGYQTGTITTSNSGGHWGPELKFAGYDMLIIEGKAEKPVYIWIYNDSVEIRPANGIWGKTVWQTEELIKNELGIPGAKIASIGPAGENLIRFAAIMNDLHRAAGRSGVGAVMGSKNLKAIAVKGSGGVRIARPAEFHRATFDKKSKLKISPVTGTGLPTYGTEVLMNVINEAGAMPTRNFQEAQFEGADNISGETLAGAWAKKRLGEETTSEEEAETRTVANKACFACTIACGRVTEIPSAASGQHRVTTSPHNWRQASEGPEYEPAWALGSNCGIDDLDALLKANFLCNELGMDPISMGATLAAAMELYEKGAIKPEETDIPLNFGNADALVGMVERTAYRQGFGDKLAEGSKRLTEQYGHPDLFMGVKGSEFPAYEPRGIQGMGLSYATSNRGACHLRAYTVSSEILGIPEKTDPRVTEGKAGLVKAFQDATSVVDAAGLCVFLTFGIGLPEIREELNAAVGRDYTEEDLLKAGERIFNIERMWNLKAGFTGADDTLPKRILKEAIPAGPNKGAVNRLHEMLPEYYELRGWSADGVPRKEKLQELGITH
ncbi:MAG: aldehyde ferredoxin oxidoreductase family protein [Planctomycetota bacterium]|nr:aldehyde ferredoxin oxidoreductase family protein [Planctomycetota bacterium]